MYQYDSHNEFYKQPFGAVPAGQPVTFTVKTPKFIDPNLTLLVFGDGDGQHPAAVVNSELTGWDEAYDFRTCRFTPPLPGLYFYCFEANEAGGRRRIGKGEKNALRQLTVYAPDLATPVFLKGGLIYQIFPDRFCKSEKAGGYPCPEGRVLRGDWGALPKYLPDEDGKYRPNDYFGGDLPGITERLPYLKSLGVTALYLNPVFEAHSNHRYNTADYFNIDPLLGTNEDFRNLCAHARELGIAVILDGVFSHTGSDSLYFNKEGRYGSGGAWRDPESPYRSWFAIQPDGSYDSWWGFETLPNVNETDPGYLEFICGQQGVAAHWLREGASGWRLDVADELPDAFLDAFTAAVKKEDPQALVMGEVWEDASNKSAYGVRRRYLLGGQLDSVMNYPFRDAIFSLVRDKDAAGALEQIRSIVENYPKPVLDCLMNALSTHDVERAISALGGEPIAGHDRRWQGEHHTLSPQQYAKGKALLMLASVMQYTLPGVPSLYYGDEAGLYGYKDPFNRGCFPWGQQDEELTKHFETLGKLRAHPAFRDGVLHPVRFEGGFACYRRDSANGCAFVVVNAGNQAEKVELPPEFSTKPTLVCGKYSDGAAEPGTAVVFFANNSVD